MYPPGLRSNWEFTQDDTLSQEDTFWYLVEGQWRKGSNLPFYSSFGSPSPSFRNQHSRASSQGSPSKPSPRGGRDWGLCAWPPLARLSLSSGFLRWLSSCAPWAYLKPYLDTALAERWQSCQGCEVLRTQPYIHWIPGRPGTPASWADTSSIGLANAFFFFFSFPYKVNHETRKQLCVSSPEREKKTEPLTYQMGDSQGHHQSSENEVK